METTTITKTITQPTEAIENFADRKGYMSEIHNPEYVADLDKDGNVTDNNKPATIANPQTKQEFVSKLFDEFVAKEFFGVFAEQDAVSAKLAEAEALATSAIEAIKSTIVTS